MSSMSPVSLRVPTHQPLDAHQEGRASSRLVEEVAAGADLNTTTLRRHFAPQVFKHDQRPLPADSWMQRRWCVLHDLLKRKNYIARNSVRVRARGYCRVVLRTLEDVHVVCL